MADWIYTGGCKMPDDRELPAGVRRYAAIVQYQGAEYCGFQRQKHSPSVQQELESALSYVAASPVTISCAGRTDTAVHASHQVVHFDSAAQRTGYSWVQGANSQLPQSIALIWADQVNKGFHARFSAQSRTYRYVIDNSPTRPAILAKAVTWVKNKLDAAAMQNACQYLLGEQDYSAFRAAGCQSNSAFRNIQSAKIFHCGQLIVFEITANAFLLHMVRNIMGSLLEVGLGRQQPAWIQQLLAGADRCKSAATAAACGLYLVDVEYPDHFGLPQLPKGPVFLPAKLGNISDDSAS
ncbi:MAG: tRNA pseudouridine(38-40) synthase TruA [Porticoccaceae bacterium]|nr:tRNA pseudouridine(38-40) synthase TruA [Porticoccaceae bacterium]